MPPEINPPCEACDNTAGGASESEAAVNAFIQVSEQPEVNEITYLISVERNNLLLEGLQSNSLSAPAEKCISKFASGTIDDAVTRLTDRLVSGKAVPMAQQYDKDSKRAYAGIRLILDIAREMATLRSMGDASSEADQQSALDSARTWTETVANNADSDISQKHQYNLCPVYLQIFRNLESLGGSSVNTQTFEDAVQKMDDMLHFDVTMDIHATGDPGQSGQMNLDASWQLKTTLYLQLDLKRGCFTPKLENNNDLQVTVQNFTLTAKGTQIDLISPREFTAPVAFVTLTLCDKNPILALHFTNYGPTDEIEVEGRTSYSTYFQSMWEAAVNTPLTAAILTDKGVGSGTSSDVNGSGGNSGSSGSNSGSNSGSGASGGSLTLSTPKPSPSPNAQVNAIKQKMAKIKADLQAHASDPSWLMGPQGQADIAQIQSLTTQETEQVGQMVGPGVAAGLEQANILELHWTNGTTNVADEQFRFTTHGYTETLHVTVQQAPK